MYKKGTIILTPFPFTDLSGSKVRPALIISNGKIGSHIVILFITSQNKLKDPYSVTVKPSKENGVKAPSKILCSKIATLENKVALGEIGSLSKSDLKKVDSNLKKILTL